MNDSEKVSAIKRINERLADIKRAVTSGSLPKSFYDRFRAAIDQDIPQQFLTKSGNISHGKGAVSFIKDKILQVLQSRQTRGEIRQSAKEHIREENPFDYEGTDEVPESEVEEYLDDADFVNTELTENYAEAYEILSSVFGGSTGKKSYKQLREALEGRMPATAPARSITEIYFT